MSGQSLTKAIRNWRAYDSVCALLVYLILSGLFFGRGLVGHFSDRLVGNGPDASAAVFFLEWWPYALLNHLNPFVGSVVWAPQGFDFASTTFAPLAGIAAAPITLWAGPVAAYNASMLLAPALSAWAAFMLCRLICGRFWPALASGYVFGFSAYVLSHMLGQLDLAMAFFPPLAIYLVVRRIRGEISAWRLAALLGLVLLGQTALFLEILATMTLFGGIALVLEWSFADQSARKQITGTAVPIAVAYALAALVASPYLYYFFMSDIPRLSMNVAYLSTTVTANLLLPTTVNLFGSSRIAALCGGLNLYEAGQFLGPVAIIIVYGLARSQWRRPGTRLLVAMLTITVVASLGPYLFVAGLGHVPMPWRLIARLPLFDKAQPARVIVFSFLVLAVIVSLWLADGSRQPKSPIMGAAALLIIFLPNPNAAFWTRPIDAPPFFAQGLYRKYIAPGDTVLILPYGIEGESDIWQAMSGMYFRMAGGYVGMLPVVPPEYTPFAAVREFYFLATIPDSGAAVRTFLKQKNVRAVIVADEGNQQWRPVMNGRLRSFILTPLSDEEKAAVHSMFATVGVAPIRVGGVALYLLPSDALAANRAPQ